MYPRNVVVALVCWCTCDCCVSHAVSGAYPILSVRNLIDIKMLLLNKRILSSLNGSSIMISCRSAVK